MRRRGVLALVLLIVFPPVASAQSLREKVQDLFKFGDCGQVLCLDTTLVGSVHGSHFIPDAQNSSFAVVSFLSDAVALAASSTPLGSTSSGVTFRIVGGVPVQNSNSLGPVFGERGPTLGRGRFLMGANITGSRFKTLRGVPIDNLHLTFTHQDIGNPGLGDPAFENDVINMRMSLYVDLLVSSFFATYGLTDHIDVGVAVPLVYTSIRGRSTAVIVPFDANQVLHFFGGTSANPILRASSATFGSATGIGDIASRIKINFSRADALSFAILGDLRFATGDEANLLGAGHTSFRGLAVFSSQFGTFSPHLNLGYLYRGTDLGNDAFLANAGFDQALNPWATIAGEVLSEWEVGNDKHKLKQSVDYLYPYARTVDITDIPNKRDNRMNASLGFKFRTGGPTIVTNALFPVLRGGLQPNIVWTTGLEFNF
jgi:hypothetical protein